MSGSPKPARWSTLKSILRSPAHYRHAVAVPREDSDAMRLGRATHALALEPETFAQRWAIWSGVRRAGKEWDAFKADLAGREQISESEHGRVAPMAMAARGEMAALGLLAGAVVEREIGWIDQESGIACAGRPDLFSHRAGGLVLDLKTCRDASQRAFGSAAYALSYHAQLVWYADGLGMPDARMVLVAVESEPPHVVQVYELDEATILLGRADYREALRRLGECRASGEWPGYATQPQTLLLPRWAWPSEDADVNALELEGL